MPPTRIRARLYEGWNVKAYGAQGDGVTNDRVAIQECITEAIAAGGGTIIFPEGDYVIGKDGANPFSFDLVGVVDLHFLGSGIGTTRLIQSGSAGAGAWDLFRIRDNSFRITFSEMTLDQSELTSPPAGGTAHLIHVVGTVAPVSAVLITQCRFQGAVTTAGSYVRVAAVVGAVANIQIDGCTISGAATFGGIEITDALVTDVTVRGCVMDGTTEGQAVGIVTISGALRVVVCDSHIASVVAGTAIALVGTWADSTIEDNFLQGGFSTDTTASSPGLRNTIVGNRITGHVNFQRTGAWDLNFCHNVVERPASLTAAAVLGMSAASEETFRRALIQGNVFIQDAVGEVIVTASEGGADILMKGNISRSVDATGGDVAYSFSSINSGSPNAIIIDGDIITADAGAWDFGIRVTGYFQGVIANCVITNVDTGIDGASTEYIIVDNWIVATVADWNPTTADVIIAGNAGTFGPKWFVGEGSPVGAFDAPLGSLYTNRLGGAATTLFVKEAATAAGWMAK